MFIIEVSVSHSCHTSLDLCNLPILPKHTSLITSDTPWEKNGDCASYDIFLQCTVKTSNYLDAVLVTKHHIYKSEVVSFVNYCATLAIQMASCRLKDLDFTFMCWACWIVISILVVKMTKPKHFQICTTSKDFGYSFHHVVILQWKINLT